MKRVLVVAIMALVTLLVAIPVSAAPPVVDNGEANVIIKTDFCTNIEVWDNEIYSWHGDLWFDDAGNLVKFEYHYRGTDNLYNPAYPDKVLSSSNNGNFYYDARTGVNFAAGRSWQVSVPGYGRVLVASGRWSPYPDNHLAGKDTLQNPEDIEHFCAYFAGE